MWTTRNGTLVTSLSVICELPHLPSCVLVELRLSLSLLLSWLSSANNSAPVPTPSVAGRPGGCLLVLKMACPDVMPCTPLKTASAAAFPAVELLQVRTLGQPDLARRRRHHLPFACRQLVQEQIPKRKMQLLQMYGPGGATPLLPDVQLATASLVIGRIDASSPEPQQFLELVNNNRFAIDVSGWMLAGAVQATLKPGEATRMQNKALH